MGEEKDAMDLEDFVRLSLVQIVNGVKSASTEVAGSDPTAIINPRLSNSSYTDPVLIKFDIAVTVTGKRSGDMDGKIKVLSVFNAGGKLQVGEEHSTLSRVSFEVAVTFPSVAKEKFRGQEALDRQVMAELD